MSLHGWEAWSTQSTSTQGLPVVSYMLPYPAAATLPSSVFRHAAGPTSVHKYLQIVMQQHQAGSSQPSRKPVTQPLAGHVLVQEQAVVAAAPDSQAAEPSSSTKIDGGAAACRL